MASVTVNSGSQNLSGTGTIAAVGTVTGPNGPARIALATGTGKRLLTEFAGLAMADTLGFAVDDAVTVTNNGDGTTTIAN